MDDSLIRAFAQANGLRFEWCTRSEDGRAYASIQVWRGDDSLYSATTNGCYSEQQLLDQISAWAIEEISAPPTRYVISGWKHARE